MEKKKRKSDYDNDGDGDGSQSTLNLFHPRFPRASILKLCLRAALNLFRRDFRGHQFSSCA